MFKIVRIRIWQRSTQKIILFKIALFVGTVAILVIQIIKYRLNSHAVRAALLYRIINLPRRLMQARETITESNRHRLFPKVINFLQRKDIIELQHRSHSNKMLMLFWCNVTNYQPWDLKEEIKVKWVTILLFIMILRMDRKLLKNEPSGQYQILSRLNEAK